MVIETRNCCARCTAFVCEIMRGDGRPEDFVGWCNEKNKRIEADDLCNGFKEAKWSKNERSVR